MRKLFALCVLLGLVAAGISATHIPSVQASPPVIIFSTPTPINNVYPADQLADLTAAVNTGYGQNGTNYGVPPTSPPDEPSIAYTKMSGIRHIRDCLSGCYDQATNYYPFFQSLCTHNGIGIIGTNVTAYLTTDLSGFTTNLPCIEGIESGNEWDVETFPNGAETGATVTAGNTTYHTSFEYQYNFMIPGSWYYMNDMVGTPEPFQFTSPVSNVIGNVASAFLYNHANPTQITRYWGNTTLARVLDMNNWYPYYSPLTRTYCGQCAIYGPSFAFPKNAQFFVGLAGGTYGKWINVVEDHGYPSPMGYNPEGPSGDGSTSYTSGQDGPCSVYNATYGYTRYGYLYNNCSAELGAGATNPQQYAVVQPFALPYPMQTTEYSYKVVPVGSALNANWPDAIPDDTAVKYLTRSYMLALINHRQRMYWFTLADGTDGSSSGFCTYGLLRFNTCDPSNPAYPTAGNAWPKPDMYAWNAMIQFFTDIGCKYPGCTFVPAHVNPIWSNTALPFQTFNVEWSTGKLALVAWLGGESYDPSSVASCHNTYSCYLTVTPRSETVTLANMNTATLQGFDTNAADPTPSPMATTAPDGTSETIQQCTVPPVTNQFGCIATPAPLTVTNAGTSSASVTFNVTDTPQWVIPVLSPAVPSPAPTSTTTANPLPTGTPTSYPNPTPSPTPLVQSTPTPIPTATATANSYYVATTGSDSNAGTGPNVPFLTIEKAATVATAAGRNHVVIGGGTYTYTSSSNSGSCSGGCGAFLTNSGTSGSPITFQCQTIGACTLSGTSPATGAGYAFYLGNAVQYTNIIGFMCQNFVGGCAQWNSGANGAVDGNRHVTFEWNTVSNMGFVGVLPGQYSYPYTIANNSFSYIGSYSGYSTCPTSNANDHAIYAEDGGGVVENNTFSITNCGWYFQLAYDTPSASWGGTTAVIGNSFGARNPVGGSNVPGDIVLYDATQLLTPSVIWENNASYNSVGAYIHCYSQTATGNPSITISYNLFGDTNSLNDCAGTFTYVHTANITNTTPAFLTSPPINQADFKIHNSSAVCGAGIAYAGWVTDIVGVPRPNIFTNPSIGAFECNTY